jgi:acetyl-CoA acetyltransferase
MSKRKMPRQSMRGFSVNKETFLIAAAIEKAKLPAESVDEVFMGNVCSSNLGQVRLLLICFGFIYCPLFMTSYHSF